MHQVAVRFCTRSSQLLLKGDAVFVSIVLKFGYTGRVIHGEATMLSILLISLSLVQQEDAKKAIDAVLDKLHLAAAQAKEDAYFDCYSETSIFLGTDATERWTKKAFREFAHPYFAKGKAWTFKATRRDVMFSKTGDIAWFDEDLKTENMGPCRGSGVMIKENGQWKVAHYNLTLTIPNDRLAGVKKLLEATVEKK